MVAERSFAVEIAVQLAALSGAVFFDHSAKDIVIRRALEVTAVEFIDENGGGPGVRLRTRQEKKAHHFNLTDRARLAFLRCAPDLRVGSNRLLIFLDVSNR